MNYQKYDKLSELKEKALALNLMPDQFTGRGGKESRRDWLNVLSQYNLILRYGNEAPSNLIERMAIESHMLCYLFSNLKIYEQEELFISKDWIFEEKLDGVRALISYDQYGKVSVYSRYLSNSDYLPIDYTPKLNLPALPDDLIGSNLILDCEIYCPDKEIYIELGQQSLLAKTNQQSTETILSLNTNKSLAVQMKYPLYFFIFDILKYNNRDFIGYKWLHRRNFLENLMHTHAHVFYPAKFNLLPVIENNKVSELQRLLNDGAEGVIAKNIFSDYNPNMIRSKMKWIKIKKNMIDFAELKGE